MDPGDRTWTLAALAEQEIFDLHYDTAARAIADTLTLKVHLKIPALRAAYADWIGSLCREANERADYRRFIAVVATFIDCLARHRIVSYSAMTRDRDDRLVDAVLTYPNEITALSAGAAIYALQVKRLTDEDPSIPLSALVLANAAAIIRRRPEATMRFRELMQLSTPWS